eukprot:COSAG02_NODE_2753_length_8093_cov_4.161746_8_plen_87_part_00
MSWFRKIKWAQWPALWSTVTSTFIPADEIQYSTLELRNSSSVHQSSAYENITQNRGRSRAAAFQVVEVPRRLVAQPRLGHAASDGE